MGDFKNYVGSLTRVLAGVEEFDDYIVSLAKMLGCNVDVKGAENPRLALSTRIALAIMTLQEGAARGRVEWIPLADCLPEIGIRVLMRLEYPSGLIRICLGERFDQEYWRDEDSRYVVIPACFVSRWCPIPDVNLAPIGLRT